MVWAEQRAAITITPAPSGHSRSWPHSIGRSVRTSTGWSRPSIRWRRGRRASRDSCRRGRRALTSRYDEDVACQPSSRDRIRPCYGQPVTSVSVFVPWRWSLCPRADWVAEEAAGHLASLLPPQARLFQNDLYPRHPVLRAGSRFDRAAAVGAHAEADASRSARAGHGHRMSCLYAEPGN